MPITIIPYGLQRSHTSFRRATVGTASERHTTCLATPALSLATKIIYLSLSCSVQSLCIERRSQLKNNLSTMFRSAFTATLAGAMLGLWTPSEAQETEGPQRHSPAPQAENGSAAAQAENGLPPASDADDPYGPPPLALPGKPSSDDVTEPVNPDEMPADSSISNHEANAGSVVPPTPVTAPAQAPPLDQMRFEEDVTGQPLFETSETLREQAEALPEEADIPNLMPPPESLPALSINPTFRLGPATVAVGLRYEALHDNNILLLPNGQQGDFEHIVSPRFSLSLGKAGYGFTEEDASANATLNNAMIEKPNYLVLNYDPQFVFFQHYGQYNAFEQELRLRGQYVLPRTVLRESFDYNHSTDPDRELQGRVSRDVVSNDIDAVYHASDRISYELEGIVLVRNFADEINSDEGQLRFWTRYRATPNWTVSLGGAGGELIPKEGTSQVFEQPWLATQNQIGTDLNVYLGVGGDFRQPDNSGQARITPLFDAIIRYAPSTETQVELSATRQIFNSSDVINGDYVSTKISLLATQRLWQTYKVAVDVGYENADYFQFGPMTARARSDNYPTAKVEFSYAKFDDLDAGVFYVVRKNFSSESYSSFSDQQVGIEFRIGNLSL
jgi:hypothetical protein